MEIGLCLGTLIGSYSRSGTKNVSLRLMLYVAPIFEINYKMSVQFWGIVPYLMNDIVEISLQKPYEIGVRHYQFLV